MGSLLSNTKDTVMGSSRRLLNATYAAVLPLVVFLSTLFVGCGTTEVSRDKFYPADWPDIAGVADDCSAIEGTFENKGVVVAMSQNLLNE